MPVGTDLGKINRQVIERDTHDEVSNVRLRTRAELVSFFEGRRKIRVLTESGTPARWNSRPLPELGHEVCIADPKHLPMCVDHADKRDEKLLSLALQKGNRPAAHPEIDAQKCADQLGGHSLRDHHEPVPGWEGGGRRLLLRVSRRGVDPWSHAAPDV